MFPLNTTLATIGALALLVLGFIFKSSISLLIRKFFSTIFASAITSKTHEITYDLRKAFCDFQIKYTNFHFNLTQSHMDFKKVFAPVMHNYPQGLAATKKK